MLARRLAQEQGADDALLVTPHGRVLEGPTTHVRVLAGRRDARHAAAVRAHPRLDHAPAPVRDRSRSTEQVLARDDLARVREAFMASTLREVHPVRAIDGAALPAAPGPLTQDGREPDPRAHRAGAGRLRLTLARPHRHREPAAVRQGRGGLAPAARRARRAARPHRPAPRRRAVDDLRHRARRPAPRARAGHPRRHATPSRRRACSPPSARWSPRSAPTSSSSTATRTRRWPAGWPPRRRACRSPTSRPACAPSIARCPRSSTACSPTTSPTCCCARRRPPSPTSSASTSPGASSSSAT